MKKTLSLVLALLLVFGLLAGCAEDTPATDPTTDGSTAATTSSTTEPTTESTTEPTTEPTTAPTTEPVTEPITEPTTEPTSAPTEPPHTHNYTSMTTKATCESKGYTTYTCTCGDSYKSDYTDATGHNYKTTTVEPTTDSKGYDLHECKNCGKSYKDNYVDKLEDNSGSNNNGNSGSCTCSDSTFADNSTCTAHTGCYYNYGTNKWIAHDCATEGHKWYDETICEKTCATTAITKYTCVVTGCTASYTEEGTEYEKHVMDADLVTKGDFKCYAIRCHCGLGFRGATYEGAYGQYESMLAESNHGNNDTNHDIDFIRIEYYEVYPEHFTCLTCGQTLCTADVKFRTDEYIDFSEPYTP